MLETIGRHAALRCVLLIYLPAHHDALQEIPDASAN